MKQLVKTSYVVQCYLAMSANSQREWKEVSCSFDTLDECKSLLLKWSNNQPLAPLRIAKKVTALTVIEE